MHDERTTGGPGTGRHTMSPRERAEPFCRRYLPHGHRQGRYWLTGDIHGAPGHALWMRGVFRGRRRLHARRRPGRRDRPCASHRLSRTRGGRHPHRGELRRLHRAGARHAAAHRPRQRRRLGPGRRAAPRALPAPGARRHGPRRGGEGFQRRPVHRRAPLERNAGIGVRGECREKACPSRAHPHHASLRRRAAPRRTPGIDHPQAARRASRERRSPGLPHPPPGAARARHAISRNEGAVGNGVHRVPVHIIARSYRQ